MTQTEETNTETKKLIQINSSASDYRYVSRRRPTRSRGKRNKHELTFYTDMDNDWAKRFNGICKSCQGNTLGHLVELDFLRHKLKCNKAHRTLTRKSMQCFSTIRSPQRLYRQNKLSETMKQATTTNTIFFLIKLNKNTNNYEKILILQGTYTLFGALLKLHN